MKNYFYLFALFLFVGVKAQIQNLSGLSTGYLEYNLFLSDQNDNIIGYALLFNKGLSESNTKVDYEYVILDKNLQKLTNGNYYLPFSRKVDYRASNTKFIDNKLVINFRTYNLSKKKYTGFYQVGLDIKNKEVLTQKHIRDYVSVDIQNSKQLEKLKDAFDWESIDLLQTKGAEGDYYNIYSTIEQSYDFRLLTQEFEVYDKNFNSLFRKKIPKAPLIGNSVLAIQDLKANQLMYHVSKAKLKGLKAIMEMDSIMVRDLKTNNFSAKINYDANLEEGLIEVNARFINNKIAVVGAIRKISGSSPTIGIRRTLYENNGNVILDKYIYFKDILSDLGFSNKKTDDGYNISLTDFYNFNDDSFALLLEKKNFRVSRYGDVSKTDGYILVNFDAEGNMLNHHILEKSKHIGGLDAYLFTQTNLDDKELIIYYQDVQENAFKIKSKELVVNKFEDGKVTQERLPYKALNSNIEFKNAKYGHILIADFNDKDEIISIRLEKINL